jgi:chloramphenicol O-acetyltransferase type A
MRYIELDNPHRKKHFDFFNSMDQPHFSICANVDVTSFSTATKAAATPFTISLVYLLARTANEIDVFRQRIRNSQIVEHDTVSPSFTVPTDVADVFSFCTVTYQPKAADFIRNAQQTMEKMRHSPSFEDEAGRDDFLFLSAIPWISFTGLTHAMHYSPVDSVPRISWGKYFLQQGQLLMPVSVQAHHALVDGRHVGQFFEKLQQYLTQPSLWL